MAAIVAVVALGVAMRPLHPFLIASHPALLVFLAGDLAAIGAAAAFARVGELPLWLPVVAGVVGMVKFDWLTWWIGRRWGTRILGMLTTEGQARRWSAWARDADPRLFGAAVALAMLPGIPTAAVFVLAGWSGMRLRVFLLLDLLGATLITGLVVGLGYAAGQRAVDVVLVVDRYASAVSIALVAAALVLPLARRLLRRLRRRGSADNVNRTVRNDRTVSMSTAESGERAKRADAVRNIESIIEAATRLLAIDPDASVNDIAKAAGVGRVTLYGHFDSSTALVHAVTERAIHRTAQMLAEVDVSGDPRDALGRLLETSWRMTHRFGAIVIAGLQAMPPDDLRRAHDEISDRVIELIERGREAGEFRDDVPTPWQFCVAQAILHGASGSVHRGEITADEAPAFVRDAVLAALSR